MVFAMGSPVLGQDCALPQSAIVTKTFPPSGGFGSWPSCGVPYLRLALCSLTCVSPGGCPSFYQVWSCAFVLGSSSQGKMFVGASTVCFSCVFLWDVVTLWVKSVFLSLDCERRFTLVVVPFRCCQPFLGSSRRIHPSSFGFSETSCGWWPRYYLACHLSLTLGCLLLASSAA